MGLFWDSRWAARIEDKLDDANDRLDKLISQGVVEMATLDEVKAAADAIVASVNDAIARIQALHDALAAALASNDPAKAQAILDELNAETTAVKAALDANPVP